MLFLIFELGSDRYAIDTSDVVEVLARASLKVMPSAPEWVAGLASYRGQTVPVIDLCRIALGRPATDRISTRTVIVRYRGTPLAQSDASADSDAGPTHLLGLIVEHANRTLRRDPAEFKPSGVDTPNAQWLGRVAHDDDGMLQWVRVEHLLPDTVRARLFTEAQAS